MAREAEDAAQLLVGEHCKFGGPDADAALVGQGLPPENAGGDVAPPARVADKGDMARPGQGQRQPIEQRRRRAHPGR